MEIKQNTLKLGFQDLVNMDANGEPLEYKPWKADLEWFLEGLLVKINFGDSITQRNLDNLTPLQGPAQKNGLGGHPHAGADEDPFIFQGFCNFDPVRGGQWSRVPAITVRNGSSRTDFELTPSMKLTFPIYEGLTFKELLSKARQSNTACYSDKQVVVLKLQGGCEVLACGKVTRGDFSLQMLGGALPILEKVPEQISFKIANPDGRRYARDCTFADTSLYFIFV